MTPGIGPLLKTWRTKRRLSQLDLALEAGVSTRHLSFVETGRSTPERADGPAPRRAARRAAAGAQPDAARRRLRAGLLRSARSTSSARSRTRSTSCSRATSRSRRSSSTAAWNVVAANAAIAMLTAGAAPHLLEPPINALRLTLHPEGMAPRIANLGQWRAHLLRDLAAAGRGDRRRGAARAAGGAARRSPDPRASPARTRSSSRSRSHGANGADLPEHPHELRHRARRDRLRAGDRVVLPRRRADGHEPFRTRRGDAREDRAGRPSSGGRAPASGRPRPAARDRARTSAAARPPAPAPARPRAAPAGAWRRRAG